MQRVAREQRLGLVVTVCPVATLYPGCIERGHAPARRRAGIRPVPMRCAGLPIP